MTIYEMPQKEILSFCSSGNCLAKVFEQGYQEQPVTIHTFLYRAVSEDRQQYINYYECELCGSKTINVHPADVDKAVSLKEHAAALKNMSTIGGTKNTGQYSEPDYTSVESRIAAFYGNADGIKGSVTIDHGAKKIIKNHSFNEREQRKQQFAIQDRLIARAQAKVERRESDIERLKDQKNNLKEVITITQKENASLTTENQKLKTEVTAAPNYVAHECPRCENMYVYIDESSKGYNCPYCNSELTMKAIKILPSDIFDIPAAPDTKGGM